MSTGPNAPPRVEAVLEAGETPSVSVPGGDVLACPRCDQEMESPDSTLPLHMASGKFCLGGGSVGAPPKFGRVIREPLTIVDVSKMGVSEILAADTCLSCGGPKSPGQTLCATDHGMLPMLLQQCLPPFVRGYLYADDKREVGGIRKEQFRDVFKSALIELAALRSCKAERVVE